MGYTIISSAVDGIGNEIRYFVPLKRECGNLAGDCDEPSAESGRFKPVFRHRILSLGCVR